MSMLLAADLHSKLVGFWWYDGHPNRFGEQVASVTTLGGTDGWIGDAIYLRKDVECKY